MNEQHDPKCKSCQKPFKLGCCYGYDKQLEKTKEQLGVALHIIRQIKPITHRHNAQGGADIFCAYCGEYEGTPHKPECLLTTTKKGMELIQKIEKEKTND